jgi:wyosine [tRNA(Phe)-imidazoG37] synthetase (radical SAM superfamily)
MKSPGKKQDFKYLYGPVPSWRLGSSLGLDPISRDEKICSFDCAYCQLGDTPSKVRKRKIYVPTEEVIEEIKKLPPDLALDYITFSGNGEPTLAANLGEIIKEVKTVRKEKIAVITNSSLMWDKTVRNELSFADFVMAKLDAPDEELFEEINRPADGIRFEDVYGGIRLFKKEYKRKLAIQIMFFDMNKDTFKKLAELTFNINPDEIQINTPLRPCGVRPLSRDDISDIKNYFTEYGKKVGSKAKITAVYDAERKKVESLNPEDTQKRRGRTE